MHGNAVHLPEPMFGVENNDGFLFRHDECQEFLMTEANFFFSVQKK